MSMIYVKDKDGKTYALPSHIIEDFEVSNVRLDSNLSSRGATAPSSDLSKLQALWSSLELDVTVAELRSILGIDDLFGQRLPSGVCSGLGAIAAIARRRARFGRGGLDLGRPRVCGGLEGAFAAKPGRFGRGGLDLGRPRVCGGLEGAFAAKPRPGGSRPPRRPGLCGGLSGFDLESRFLSFFLDPLVQNVRLRLKAHELSSYLHESD